eukprot:c19079_g1_i1 orf=181-399(+)
MGETVVLRVGMHCDKCIKEIKRAIQKLEGMETYKLDKTEQKVTVTGEVTSDEVIRMLHKNGKPAFLWENTLH